MMDTVNAQLYGREKVLSAMEGGWGPAAHGHTPSTGSTEDPSFSGGCRGGAERGGEDRGGERVLRVQVEWEGALRTLSALQTHHRDDPPPSGCCDPPPQLLRDTERGGDESVKGVSNSGRNVLCPRARRRDRSWHVDHGRQQRLGLSWKRRGANLSGRLLQSPGAFPVSWGQEAQGPGEPRPTLLSLPVDPRGTELPGHGHRHLS